MLLPQVLPLACSIHLWFERVLSHFNRTYLSYPGWSKEDWLTIFFPVQKQHASVEPDSYKCFFQRVCTSHRIWHFSDFHQSGHLPKLMWRVWKLNLDLSNWSTDKAFEETRHDSSSWVFTHLSNQSFEGLQANQGQTEWWSERSRAAADGRFLLGAR